MTPADWLSLREPPPPARLAARLAQLLESHADGAITPQALVRSSAEVVAHLVRHGETTRTSALELLAADALATYAFEIQGTQPEALDAACGWAMRHLSGAGESGAA